MNAPPGTARRPASLEARQGVEAEDSRPALSTQILMREARKVLDVWGWEMSANRLNRVIRRWVSDGRADIDFRTWFIAYADPTGETAVRNVMRGQR